MKTYLLSIASAVVLTGCTISFQNISTHGVAEDLVDETQAPSTDLKADVQVPVKAM